MPIRTDQDYQQAVRCIEKHQTVANHISATLAHVGLSQAEIASATRPLDQRIDALFRQVHAYEALSGFADEPMRWLTTIGTLIEAARVTQKVPLTTIAAWLDLPSADVQELTATDFSGLTLQQTQDLLERFGILLDLRVRVETPTPSRAC